MLRCHRLAAVEELRESAVDPDPLEQFRRWYAEAEATGMRAPQAMALATAAVDGAPSVRMVLLKGADERGFVFFTGYVSRKAAELEANPRAALLFHWEALGRQVRIEGRVERVAGQESDAYFATRPRGAQLAAAASQQSSVLRDRAEIDDRVAELAREHEGSDVRRPDHWGGYRLVPDAYEFWQHRDDRMHDRLRYRRSDGGWVVERLSP
ncbi:MAG: pyridoxamine 5'-phosphate oxidase [Actinobacteria bacterium]|nr:MAG: pyridoxamine 5'-phosphate oxidase [Actinomycetota bacterium]TML86211.1 MAG: pyridoxamine 5'-phosphate oxidase [Actinomycetota bacterium]